MTESLHQLARTLDLNNSGNLWSQDALLDRCAALYWERRPRFGLRCGTEQGYEDHRRAGQPTCADCKKAHRLVGKIRRHRRQRGTAAPRQLRPCGSHAAFVRHKANNEPSCAACENAERIFQAARPDRAPGARRRAA